MAETTPQEIKKEKPVYKLDSIMNKHDLRKMCYIATFFRNYFTIPFILILCGLGNYFVGWLNNVTDNLSLMLQTYFFLFAMTMIFMCFRVERQNKKRVKYDGYMILNNPLHLSFFETRVESTTGVASQTASLDYDSFFQLVETKEYFMFYHNVKQVSLLRKQEIEDVDEFRSFIVPKFPKKYKRIKFI